MNIEEKKTRTPYPPSEYSWQADDFNQQNEELQAPIDLTGQQRAAEDRTQLLKAIVAIAQNGSGYDSTYSISAGVETYTLTGIKNDAPLLDKARIWFKPPTTNTGSSVKISINGTAYDLKTETDGDISIGSLNNSYAANIQFKKVVTDGIDNSYFLLLQYGIASVISVPQGGTGLSNLPQNSLLIGNGNNPVSLLTPTSNDDNKILGFSTLGGWALASKIELVSTPGTNLNNYRETGAFYFSSLVTPTNIPSGINGWLIVLPAGTAAKQLWFRTGTLNSTDYYTYIRSYDAGQGGWGVWRMFTTQAI